MTNVKVNRKDVLTDAEITQELNAADLLNNAYRRLKARAIISILETGKRAGEVIRLRKDDITTDEAFLYIRFTIEKKRKKNITQLQRTKKFYVDSLHAVNILKYLEFLRLKIPYGVWLFPRAHVVVNDVYIFNFNEHMSRKGLWQIIKKLNKNDWVHQHRERRAVKEIRAAEKKDGRVSIETVYKIRNVLDLEREDTAYRYIRRHETQLVEDLGDAIN